MNATVNVFRDRVTVVRVPRAGTSAFDLQKILVGDILKVRDPAQIREKLTRNAPDLQHSPGTVLLDLHLSDLGKIALVREVEGDAHARALRQRAAIGPA